MARPERPKLEAGKIKRGRGVLGGGNIYAKDAR